MKRSSVQSCYENVFYARQMFYLAKQQDAFRRHINETRKLKLLCNCRRYMIQYDFHTIRTYNYTFVYFRAVKRTGGEDNVNAVGQQLSWPVLPSELSYFPNSLAFRVVGTCGPFKAGTKALQDSECWMRTGSWTRQIVR